MASIKMEQCGGIKLLRTSSILVDINPAPMASAYPVAGKDGTASESSSNQPSYHDVT